MPFLLRFLCHFFRDRKEKTLLKFIWNYKRPPIARERRASKEALHLLISDIVIKTIGYYHSEQADQ